MDLIAAIDLLDGGAVRLVQGDHARLAASVTDPDDVVRGWVRAGLRHLHLVDLGGARAGRPTERAAASRLASVARAAHAEVRVQLGGGLRTLDDVAGALDVADVAILGTAAIEHIDLLRDATARWPGRLAVSIDVRDERVALDGWTRDAELDPVALARTMVGAGVATVVVTDVRRDGTGRGPNLELLERARAALPTTRLVAAGGVASVEQLGALASLGIDGAVVGLALVDGSLPIGDAIEAASQVEVA